MSLPSLTIWLVRRMIRRRWKVEIRSRKEYVRCDAKQMSMKVEMSLKTRGTGNHNPRQTQSTRSLNQVLLCCDDGNYVPKCPKCYFSQNMLVLRGLPHGSLGKPISSDPTKRAHDVKGHFILGGFQLLEPVQSNADGRAGSQPITLLYESSPGLKSCISPI